VAIDAAKGWFIAHQTNGGIIVSPLVKPETGRVTRWTTFRNGGTLIQAEKGWFLAREADGRISYISVEAPDTGMWQNAYDFPDHGMILIGAEKGWFLVRDVTGAVSFVPLGRADVGGVREVYQVQNRGIMVLSDKGWFRVVAKPLSGAAVKIENEKTLDGTEADGRKYITVVLVHDCATAANELGLQLHATAPGRDIESQRPFIRTDKTNSDIAEMEISDLFIDKADRWSFQLVANSNGRVRLVGQPKTLTFVRGPWWERWWKVVAAGFGVVLALVNIVLFILARWYDRAWRMATDDGLGTWVLRVATLLLSYVPQAQLWIIDLYYQRIRTSVQKRVQERGPRLFLDLPLSRNGGLRKSTDAVAPPWTTGQRIWVQGESGMGKTALFQNITEIQFREHRRHSVHKKNGDACWLRLPHATSRQAERTRMIQDGFLMPCVPPCPARD
jgi:hypothetical protein